MAKVSRPVVYLGLAAIGVAAWMLTEPEDQAPRRGQPLVAGRQSPPSEFDEIDLNASFQPVNQPVKNVFRPLVVRTRPGEGDAVRTTNEIPNDFANGEAGWTYTGTAIVDGVPTALVEHAASGQGDFLQAGDAWRLARVVQVGPDFLTLIGPAGVSRTMRLFFEPAQQDEPAGAGSPRGNPGGFVPMQVPPSLLGPVGGMALQPTAVPEQGRGSTGRQRD